MSRGLGKLQRWILKTLEEQPRYVTCWDLTRAAYGDEHTKADAVSMRRAVHALYKRQLVWLSLQGFRWHVKLAVGLPRHQRPGQEIGPPIVYGTVGYPDLPIDKSYAASSVGSSITLSNIGCARG